jgi:DNA-binding IclR family transcriptional regulator
MRTGPRPQDAATKLETHMTMTTPVITLPSKPATRKPPVRAAAEQDTSTSVGKALSLLNAFLGSSNTVLGVSEIARRSGVAKSTAHRLLAVLESYGLVERAGDGWLPGTHLFRLGNTVSMCRPKRLRDQALPHMQELYLETRTMVNLAVLHGTQVLYVEKLVAREALDSPASVGGCMPIYCTAVGKAMLAFSPRELFDQVVKAGMPARTTRTVTTEAALAAELVQIRRMGYALDLQESKSGLACVAAPIIQNGVVIGGLSLSLHVRRGQPQQYVPKLMRAARAVSDSIEPAQQEVG